MSDDLQKKAWAWAVDTYMKDKELLPLDIQIAVEGLLREQQKELKKVAVTMQAKK